MHLNISLKITDIACSYIQLYAQRHKANFLFIHA